MNNAKSLTRALYRAQPKTIDVTGLYDGHPATVIREMQ
jgi:hypothetical protein